MWYNTSAISDVNHKQQSEILSSNLCVKERRLFAKLVPDLLLLLLLWPGYDTELRMRLYFLFALLSKKSRLEVLTRDCLLIHWCWRLELSPLLLLRAELRLLFTTTSSEIDISELPQTTVYLCPNWHSWIVCSVCIIYTRTEQSSDYLQNYLSQSHHTVKVVLSRELHTNRLTLNVIEARCNKVAGKVHESVS